MLYRLCKKGSKWQVDDIFLQAGAQDHCRSLVVMKAGACVVLEFLRLTAECIARLSHRL